MGKLQSQQRGECCSACVSRSLSLLSSPVAIPAREEYAAELLIFLTIRADFLVVIPSKGECCSAALALVKRKW